MSLKDNISEQKEYLEKNLEQLNTVVSAILGYKTKLKVKEIKQGNKTYFSITDDRNIKEKCGVMAKAFKEVSISTFSMWWQEDGVVFNLHFNYTLNDYGSNGVEFCRIKIVNGLVTIV